MTLMPVMALAAPGKISGGGGGNYPLDPSKDDVTIEFLLLDEDIQHQSVPFGTQVRHLSCPGG